MNFMQKALRWLVGYGFRVSFAGFALLLGVMLTFQTSGPLKTTVDESGLYDIPLHKLIEIPQPPEEESRGAPENEQEPVEQDLSLEDPIVQDAVSAGLPPAERQRIVEDIIDGTYVWLNQNADAPTFEIDLTKNKTTFIQTLADGAFERVDSLEPCTLQQLQELDEIDPFSIECKPKDNLSAEKQTFINELSTSDFLSDPTFTGQDLLKETKRQGGGDLVSALPTIYAVNMNLPIVFAVIMLITAPLIIFMEQSRREGLRRLGKLLMYASVTAGIILGAGYFILSSIRSGANEQGATEFGASLSAIVGSLRDQILIPGIIIVGVGLVLGLALYFTNRNQKHPQQPKDQKKPVDTAASADAENNDSADDANSKSEDHKPDLPPGMAEKIAAAKKDPDKHTKDNSK